MSDKRQNFVQLCLDGRVLLDEIDDFVEQWHNAADDILLHDFLGMTKHEYELWVVNPNILPYIIAARHDNMSVEELLNTNSGLPMAARSIKENDVHQIVEWLRARGKLN